MIDMYKLPGPPELDLPTWTPTSTHNNGLCPKNDGYIGHHVGYFGGPGGPQVG